MPRKDLIPVTVIGAAGGLLVQPILENNVPAGVPLTLAVRAGAFAGFTLLAPLALWIASRLARWAKGIYQFAQFAAVGTLNTFIDVGIFNLEAFLYGAVPAGNLVFALFKAVSFLCATGNSFVWNKYWTFGVRDRASAGQVGGFYGVAAVGWALNVGAATLVKSLGPSTHLWVDLAAPLGGVVASFLWDFIGYKYFVFGGKKPSQEAAIY